MAEVSYAALLRRNRNFRLMWLGGVISQIGDWFNAIAVYALLLDLTGGSATAVAWMMVIQFLPLAVAGPLAGVVVDRIDRRWIMIVSDVARGVLVLGLLLVRSADWLWLAYAVMASTVAARAFFEPARTATIPSITTPDELLAANALSSASWAAMLAIGAALGGLVTAVVGQDAAFIVNAVSFFVSAALIARMRYRGVRGARPTQPPTLAEISGVGDLLEGLRYVRARAYVAGLLSIKAGWGIAGGAMLLLTIFGDRIFPVGGSAAAGIGVLFGARGVGALAGGLLTKTIGHEPLALRRTLAPAYLVYGAGYVALAYVSTHWLAAIVVLVAHGAGSVLWVTSTVLLQLYVPDAFRGRVFAVELALMTVVASTATYLTAYALDGLSIAPQTMAMVLGLAFVLPGGSWLFLEAHWRHSRPELEPGPDAGTSSAGEQLRDRLG